MIALYVEIPYASFRKSFARSYAESYLLPPPATVYGMLLSLVGEKFRSAHEGVKLAFAYRRTPKVAVTLRKLSRYKYGVPGKQEKEGNKPDFIETVCGIELMCWIDSSEENGTHEEMLTDRLEKAIQHPETVSRYGVLSLGLSDDMVNEVSICRSIEGKWHRLVPKSDGAMDLPIWVDHVGSAKTRWQRFQFDDHSAELNELPGSIDWEWVRIVSP
jgi:CRISPR-associated protein Cas5t